MTKTTRRSQGHTDAQVAAGWRAIERQANGAQPVPAAERVEIGSAASGFDLPPAQ